MKQLTVSIRNSLLLCLISLILFILGYSLAEASNKRLSNIVTVQNTAKKTQLGFYDLLSNKQEIYNIEVTPTHRNNYIASLAMTTDPSFILKGKVSLAQDKSNNYSHLNFTPVFYQNPKTNRMIHSLVDYTTYNDILIHNLKINSNQLIVSHFGILILMTDVFSLPK